MSDDVAKPSAIVSAHAEDWHLIDALMGDEWAGFTEEEVEAQAEEAAQMLRIHGQALALPGRYDQMVESILGDN